MAMITRKVCAALAAGCTTVWKPAGETPLSAGALAILALDAGFPPKVIQIVTTLTEVAAVGEEICTNKLVNKVSFTGSTRVGKLLMQQCASTMKKLSLELGGNSPFIVFDDANVEVAVESMIMGSLVPMSITPLLLLITLFLAQPNSGIPAKPVSRRTESSCNQGSTTALRKR